MPGAKSRKPIISALATMTIAASIAAVGGLVTTSANAFAADSLASPITGPSLDQMWPIEVTVTVTRRVETPTGTIESSALPAHVVTVPDGHRIRYSGTTPTAHGRCRFQLDVVARHHPDAIELEWDLEVSEATFSQSDWKRALLGRLHLGPGPRLEPERLRTARSDIIETRDAPHRQVLEIGGEVFAIEMRARSLRG